MGTGASKKKDEPVATNFDDDEDDADDGFDQELERRRKEFQKRERLEKAGKLPQISGEASRKIVGLMDSDDENEDHRNGPFNNKLAKKGGKVREDDKLTKELKELEQTFKSIEEEERKGWGLSRSSNWGKQETHSAFTPSNRQTLENNGSWSASPPTFPRNAPKTSHRSRGGPTPFVPGNASKPTLTKTLKFSWDEQPTIPQDKNSDEWTYKQTVINGFDPDKFRRVNNKNVPSFDSDIRIERRIQSPAGSTFQMPASMPGVPSYDPTEKQLLATIEQELGVL